MIRALLLLVLLAGCAAPRQAARDLPLTLAEVNARLAAERVTVELTDGTQIASVRHARVEPDRLSFPGRALTTLPIGDVVRITTVEGRGVRSGAWTGAAPGLLTVGAGAAIGAGAARSGYLEGDALVGAGVALLGVVAAATGAVIGGFGASHARPGERVTIYQGPVDRYLAAPADAP